mgnify:CR=1 FL=1
MLDLPYDPGRALRSKMADIEPEYTKLLAQLFYEIACMCVECGQVATLLSQAHHTSQPDRIEAPNLRSWVPDWSSPTYCHTTRQKPYKNVARWLRVERTIDHLLRALILSGVQVDLLDCAAARTLDSIPMSTAIEEITSS